MAHDGADKNKALGKRDHNPDQVIDTIFNSAANFLAIINESFQVEKINDKGLAYANKRPGQLIGTFPGDVFNCLNSFSLHGCGTSHRCKNCLIRLQIENVFNTGKAQNEKEYEIFIQQPDKVIECIFLISTQPIILEGEIKALLSITDVTEIKQLKDTLSQSESSYQYLFENAPVAFMVQDFSKVFRQIKVLETYGITDLKDHFKDNNQQLLQLMRLVEIAEINAAACSLYDCNREELIKGGLKNILDPEDTDHFLEQIVDFHGGKTTFQAEIKQKTIHGDSITVFLRKAVINSDPESFKILVSAIDLTELYAIKNEKEILTDQLQQAQKLEAIGALAGGIAHDFNNILTAIMGFTEIHLGEQENHPELATDLKEIYTGAIRARELIKQLLNFARKSENKKAAMRLTPIVKEVIKLIRSTTPATISIDLSTEGDPIILGDPLHIHQMLVNLCTNAIHAMEDANNGRLTILLRDVVLEQKTTMYTQELAKGSYAKLEVKDTGKGIPPEDIAAIFDPFFTTKPAGEGTGLGLSVVQNIVESYGGKLAIESELGKGTSFHIYLPLHDGGIDQSVEFDPDPPPRGNEKILFVDDEKPISILGEKLLSKLGYEVTSFNDSRDALEDFKSRPDYYDLVITDLSMPHISGDLLIEKISEIQKGIPCILCTGYSKKLKDGRINHPSIKAVYLKPINISDLAIVVRDALEQSTAGS